MNEAATVAEWLRQREGETDAAWIERLAAVFGRDQDLSEDTRADKLGERLWKRFEARVEGAKKVD